MLLAFNKIKPYKIYGKSPVTLTPIGMTSKPNRGFIVYSLTDNKDFTFQLVNKNFLPSQYFHNLYMPKFVKVGGRVIRFTDRNKWYKDFKENNVSKYTNYIVNPTILKGRNIVLDFSKNLSTFNDRFIGKGKVKNQNFLGLISHELSVFKKEFGEDYTEKPYIILDVSDVLSPSQNISNYFNIVMHKQPTVLQNFYYFIRNNKLDAAGSLTSEMKDFLDCNFIFYSSKNGFFFKVDFTEPINWSKLNSNIKLMLKLNSKIGLDKEEEQELEALTAETEETSEKTDKQTAERTVKSKELKIANSITNKLKSIFKLDNNNVQDNKYINKLTDEIESLVVNSEKFSTEADLMARIDQDPEIKKTIKDISNFKVGAFSNINPKREENVSELNALSIKDLLSDFKSKEIQVEQIPIDKGIMFKEIKESKLKDFEKSYNESQADKDLAAIISSFGNKDGYPMRLVEVNRTDTSDDFNKKDTLEIKYSDKNNELHTIKIDVPRMLNEKFLFLNNGKKSIVKQLVMLPIIKVKPDTVKITTNYNIVHITRFGSKIDGNMNKLKKIFKDISKTNPEVKVKLGSNKGKNRTLPLPIDFMEFSTFVHELSTSNLFISTDVNKVIATFENYSNINYTDDKKIPIGYTANKKKFILFNLNDNSIDEFDTKTNQISSTNLSFYNYLRQSFKASGFDNLINLMDSTKPPKKLTYSRAKVLNRNIPLAFLIMSQIGFEEMLKRYVKNDYKLVEDIKEIKQYKSNHNYNVITFRNKSVVYKNQHNYNLLLNALADIDSRGYDFEDLNDPQFYLEYFNDYFGSRNIQKGVNNLIDLLIDPITKDVLNSLELPEDCIDLLLYGNDLLDNTNYSKGNNLSNYRIRSNEIVNAYLYRILASSYNEYRQRDKDRRGSTSKVKMSVPQNALIKNLLEDPLVNNFSTLNPFLEAQDLGAVTFRGIAGINMADAIQLDTRSYDKSFVGTLGLSSPDSDKIGVVRQLTYNPSIINNRGMIKIDDSNTKNLKASNMLTPVELLGPYTITRADPQRSQMFSVQSKHFMPTKEQSMPLIGTGVERTIAHVISDDFIYIAKDDGVVESIDEKLGIMVVKYKSGKTAAIDISEKPSPNSGGGFYISNKKNTILKPGDKFKKDSVLAKNEEYFLDNEYGDVTLTNGRLTKAAFTSGWFTFEDSCVVTEGLSHAMSSQVTMKKTVKFGPNTNIQSIVSKGDKIKTGKPLVTFEQSFNDAIANQVLDTLGDEFGEVISDLSRNIIKSKYTGEIVDIVIYYNKPIEEMSPSIQKVLNKYIKEVEKKRSILAASSNKDDIVLPSVDMVDEELKVNGEEFDGLMIEFYIRYEEPMMIGSKLTAAIALKSIIADVIPYGQEPYSDFRKDEHVDIIISPLSIINRMTTEIMNLLYGNKVLIEAKKSVRDIFYE